MEFRLFLQKSSKTLSSLARRLLLRVFHLCWNRIGQVARELLFESKDAALAGDIIGALIALK